MYILLALGYLASVSVRKGVVRLGQCSPEILPWLSNCEVRATRMALLGLGSTLKGLNERHSRCILHISMSYGV